MEFERIKLMGRHAKALMLLTNLTNDKKNIPFMVSDNASMVEVGIFDSKILCYIEALFVGLYKGLKAPLDKDKEVSISIAPEVVKKNQKLIVAQFQEIVLWRLSQVGNDREKRNEVIKEYNSVENFDAYVRGGLDYLYDAFKDCKSVEDVNRVKSDLNALSEEAQKEIDKSKENM